MSLTQDALILVSYTNNNNVFVTTECVLPTLCTFVNN